MSGKRFPARFPGLAVLLAVTLIGGVTLVMTASAADRGEGTVNLTDTPMTGWSGGPFAAGEIKNPVLCTTNTCDTFKLTVADVPKTHWDTAKGGVDVKIAWQDEAEDFDLFVYDKTGALVGSAENGGTSSERVFIDEANSEDGPYEVVVMPWSTSPDTTYNGGAWMDSRPDDGGGSSDAPLPTDTVSEQPCTDGLSAGVFPCENVDLESFMPKGKMGSDAELNDIWGWTDPATNHEYALVGRTNGTSFVDVTDAQNPIYLGDLPSHQSVAGQPVETIFNSWRDIKVYKNHAYVGSEEPSHGLQVFDLTQLRGKTAPQDWDETAHYSFVHDGIESVLDPDPTRLNTLDNSHNLAINEESGMLSAIGTSTCGGGGPHMIDITEPAEPKFAGCDSEDGYTHDNQCVNYRQSDPDTDHRGKEICFNSNEDTLTIVDVTDPQDPKQLARMPYEGASYTHQAWLTEDRRFLLMDDELDEQEGTAADGKTATYVVDVQNLDNPVLVKEHAGEAESIDHNQYIRGDRSFQSNYRSGLRILNVADVANAGALNEVGFFDVYPADDEPEFNGTWSNYPYFKSGIVIASGIEQGLFVVRPTGDAPFTPGTERSDEGESAGSGSASTSTTGGSGSAGGVKGTTRSSRLRAGFGIHRYGRVRGRTFGVQCRLRGGAGRQVCAATAKVGRRTIGSGRSTFAPGQRVGIVRVRLNAHGRQLLVRRPRGLAARVLLSARDSEGRRAANNRRYVLRAAR